MHPRGNALHEKLKSALRENSPKLLREAFDDICDVLTEPVQIQPKCFQYRTPSCLSALVICSECALKLEDIEIAQDCNKKFFEHAPQYDSLNADKAIAPIDVENQWKIRALYIAGVLHFEKNKHLGGKEFRDIVLIALQKVVDGIATARKSSRYQFLVYNGTIHYWKIASTLLKEGMRYLLLPSARVVAETLKDLPAEKREWKASCLIKYALCLQEVGKTEEAMQMANEACTCITESENKDMMGPALQLKIHLAQQAGKFSPNDQKAGGDAFEALATLQSIKSAKLPAQEAEKKLNELVEKCKSTETKGNDMMADIGWTAYVHGLLELSKTSALNAKELAKDPLARLRADLTLQALELEDADNTSSDKRVRVISKLDEMLSSLIRIGDASAIQDCCVLIWNAALFLQKVTTRRFIMHPFTNAVQILDKMDSPLIKMRVQFHVEIARGALENNMLSNAAKHADKGTYLYETFLNTSEGGHDPNDPKSKLGEVLMDLKRRVRMKFKRSKTSPSAAATTEAPKDFTNVEAFVLQTVESVLEATSTAQKEDLLNDAVNIMNAMEESDQATKEAKEAAERKALETEEGEEKAPEKEEEESEKKVLSPAEVQMMQRKILLWNRVLQSAWKAKFDKIVRQCATHIFPEYPFDVADHASIIEVQIQAVYADAQACLLTLDRKGVALDPPMEDSSIDVDAFSGIEDGATDDDLMVRACSQFIRGIKLSLLLQDYSTALNGATFVWNTFLKHVVREEYNKIVHVMKVLLTKVMEIPEENQDFNLLGKLCTALACGIEHRVLINWANNEGNNYTRLQQKQSENKTLKLSPEDAGSVEEAMQSCESVLTVLNDKTDNALTASHARLKRLVGKSPSVKAGQTFANSNERIAYVVHVIEQVQNETLSGKSRKEALKDATKAVKEIETPFYELIIHLAQISLDKDETHSAIEVASECLGILGFDKLDLSQESDSLKKMKTEYDWYIGSVCEMVWGEASLQVRQLKQQDQSIQIHMYKIAVDKFLKAARYAFFAKNANLVLRIGRLFWNVMVEFVSMPDERIFFIESLEEMLSYIDKTMGICNTTLSKDRDLSVCILKALLEAYSEEEEWDNGLNKLTPAFRVFPQRDHLPLWKKRTYFLIRAGLDPMSDEDSMKDHSAEVKSLLWHIIAMSTAGKEDQYLAYLQAADCFANDKPKKAKALLVLADWMVKQRFPQDDIDQTLSKIFVLALDSKLDGDAPTSAATHPFQASDTVMQQCSAFELTTLFGFFTLSMQMATNFSDLYAASSCAVACAQNLLISGVNEADGPQEGKPTFPSSVTQWKELFTINEVSSAWLKCVDGNLDFEKYSLYKNAVQLVETLMTLRNYTQCLTVSWLVVLLEKSSPDKNDGIGYLLAAKAFTNLGDMESATAVEAMAEAELRRWMDARAKVEGTALDKSRTMTPSDDWSPLKPFLNQIEYSIGKGTYGRAAQLLKKLKATYDVDGARGYVRDEFHLLSALLEAKSNNFEAASKHLHCIKPAEHFKAPIKFWEKYASTYVEMKLGSGSTLHQVHAELSSLVSILERAQSSTPNNVGYFDFKNTIANMLCIDARMYFSEAEDIDTYGLGADKEEEKLIEAFGLLDMAAETLRDVGGFTFVDMKMNHAKRLQKRAWKTKAIAALDLGVSLLNDAEEQCKAMCDCALASNSTEFLNKESAASCLACLGQVRTLKGTLEIEYKEVSDYEAAHAIQDVPEYPKVEGKDSKCVEDFLIETMKPQISDDVLDTFESAGILADDSIRLCAGIDKLSPKNLLLLGKSLASQRKTMVRKNPAGPVGIEESEVDKTLQRCLELALKESDMDTALSATKAMLSLSLDSKDSFGAALNIFMAQSCEFSLSLSSVLSSYAEPSGKNQVLMKLRESMLRELTFVGKAPEFKSIQDDMDGMGNVRHHMSLDFPCSELVNEIQEDTIVVSFHVAGGVQNPFEPENLHVACLQNTKEDGMSANVASIPFDKDKWSAYMKKLSSWKAKSERVVREFHNLIDDSLRESASEGQEDEEGEKPTVEVPKAFKVESQAVLIDGWEHVMEDTRAMLQPLLETINKALGFEKKEETEGGDKEQESADGESVAGTEEGSNKEESGDEPAEEVSDLRVCLCVDSFFSTIPFEGLEEFRKCKSVSRNPSFVTFCILNRMLKEGAQGGGKPYACAKDFSKLRFVVDPKGQLADSQNSESEGSPYAIASVFSNSIQKPFKDWEGTIGTASSHVGEDHMQHTFDGCSSMLCVTSGALESVLSPNSILRTNLKACKVAIMMDKVLGMGASVEETHTTPEDHIRIATLLICMGVSACVTNSMSGTNKTSADFLEQLIQNLSAGKEIAEAAKDASKVLVDMPGMPPHLPWTPVVYGVPFLVPK